MVFDFSPASATGPWWHVVFDLIALGGAHCDQMQWDPTSKQWHVPLSALDEKRRSLLSKWLDIHTLEELSGAETSRLVSLEPCVILKGVNDQSLLDVLPFRLSKWSVEHWEKQNKLQGNGSTTSESARDNKMDRFLLLRIRENDFDTVCALELLDTVLKGNVSGGFGYNGNVMNCGFYLTSRNSHHEPLRWINYTDAAQNQLKKYFDLEESPRNFWLRALPADIVPPPLTPSQQKLASSVFSFENWISPADFSELLDGKQIDEWCVLRGIPKKGTKAEKVKKIRDKAKKEPLGDEKYRQQVFDIVEKGDLFPMVLTGMLPWDAKGRLRDDEGNPIVLGEDRARVNFGNAGRKRTRASDD